MNLYTVHENPELGDEAERIVLVKQGFNWMCLTAPAAWFLWRRHWVGLAGFMVFASALGAALGLLGVSEDAAMIVLGGVQLAVAFEANDWRRHALQARGYELVNVVAGRNLAEAEWRYFDAAASTGGEGGGTPEPPAPRLRAGFAQPVSEFLRRPVERPGAL